MQIKPWMRAACVALATSALWPAAAHAGTWCSSGKPVHFAGVTWESGSFTSEVLRYITVDNPPRFLAFVPKRPRRDKRKST